MPNKLTAGIREILQQQGLSFDGSDDDLTLALGALGRKELAEKFPDFADEYRAIREANAPGTVEGIANTAKNAFDRSRQALSTIGGIGADAAENIASAERRIQSRPATVPWEDWQRAEGTEAFKVFARDPIEILSNIVVSGLTGSVPAIAGGLAGGVAGSAAGGPAAPLTGTIGAVAGTGAGSLAVEYGNKYLDVLRDAGADLSDPESIARVVADPDVQDKARTLGLKRGIPVAAFDAISAGLAGKFLKGVRTATTAQNVRRGAAEAFIQGGLGGAGEVAGALSAGDPISGRAVFEEVVGELGPGAVEVGGAALRRRMAEQALQPTQTIPAPRTPVGAPLAPVPQQAVSAPTAEPSALAPAETQQQSPARRVALMTDEERVARIAELQPRADLTPAEAQELELLQALTPTAPAAPATPPTLPIEPTPTGETGPAPEPVSVTVGEATGMGPTAETVAPSAAPAVTPIPPADFLAPASVGDPVPSVVLPEPITTEAAPVEAAQPSAVPNEFLARPTFDELRGQKVMLEDVGPDGATVVAEYDAADAWAETQKRRSVYQKLLNCLRGEE